MRLLVTGSAGFIGYHTANHFLAAGHDVVGVDNLNPYYDVTLKQARLARLEAHPNYRHYRMDIEDGVAVAALFKQARFDRVIHLAAQAGVRYSLDHPDVYVDSNVRGFLSILEACRHFPVEHLVFASSSSVYGANGELPFASRQPTEHPLSIYAATKKANEMMAHAYAHLFRIPCTGLRLFTVYGPWGRPDMALFKFTEAMLADRAIEVYGEGQMHRDFTYIDDIVAGVVAATQHIATPDPGWDARDPDPSASGVAPYRIYNLGNGRRIELVRYVQVLEKALGCVAKIEFMPMQPGDVRATEADIGAAIRDLGFAPNTSVEEGVARFVDWYRAYYKAL